MPIKIVTRDNLSNQFRIVNYLLEVNIDNETIIEDNGVLKVKDTYLLFEQNTPSSVWLIIHNLEKKPIVQVFNSSDDEIVTKVTNVDLNTCIIELNDPKSGYCIIKT